MSERYAPEGKIWQCAACGKLAEDNYGLEGWHSYGWDESCMLNSHLVDRNQTMAPPDHRKGRTAAISPQEHKSK